MASDELEIDEVLLLHALRRRRKRHIVWAKEVTFEEDQEEIEDLEAYLDSYGDIEAAKDHAKELFREMWRRHGPATVRLLEVVLMIMEDRHEQE